MEGGFEFCNLIISMQIITIYYRDYKLFAIHTFQNQYIVLEIYEEFIYLLSTSIFLGLVLIAILFWIIFSFLFIFLIFFNCFLASIFLLVLLFGSLGVGFLIFLEAGKTLVFLKQYNLNTLIKEFSYCPAFEGSTF